MQRPIITLLTDFGSLDHYVAAMKGIILGICPDAQLVDISHEVPPFEIAEGAYTLSQAWTCFPAETVHLVVVDPGVGSERRPIVAEIDGHFFVAPDNGVLTMAFGAASAISVRAITAESLFRSPLSQTFHGRDIFAPVAAHLAAGLRTEEVGEPVEDFLRLTFDKPVRTARRGWTGSILKVDRFGNIVTNFDWATFDRVATLPFELHVGLRSVGRLAANYSSMADNEPFVIRGSGGYLEISVNQAHAGRLFGVAAGSPVELRFI